MKRKITAFLVAMFLMFLLVPAVKSEAASLGTPTGISLNAQKGKEFQIAWDFDYSLNTYYQSGYGVGYEMQITNLKGAEIATYTSVSGDMGILSGDSTKYGANVSNSAMKSKPFKVKVRSFIYDTAGQYTYSEFSKEKIIVPRPTIKGGKATGGGAKITWNKIKGAKSYTVYLSSNNGKSFKKVTTTKSTSATISNLKRYKDYYVYVQADKVKCNKKRYNSTKPLTKTSNAYSFYIYTTYR